MRIIPLFAVLSLCALAIPATPPAIPDFRAIKYLGREVVITGTVSGVDHRPNGSTALNLGGTYPNQTVSIDISSLGSDDQHWAKQLLHRQIRIRGIVEVRDWKPEVRLRNRAQIVDSDPAPLPISLAEQNSPLPR